MRVDFQGSINQLLGMGAIGAGFYTQTPGFKAKQELSNLNKQKGIIQGQLASENAAQAEQARRGLKPSEADKAIHKETGESLEGIFKRQFELDPTEENYQLYRGVKNLNMLKRETAMQNMQQNGISQVQQKDTFDSLMKRLKEDKHPAYSGDAFNKLSKEEQKDVVTRLIAGGAK